MSASTQDPYRSQLHLPAAAVVITGGASGIGLSAARALAAVGRPVALWDINEEGAIEEAAKLAADYGVAAVGLKVDLINPEAYAPAAKATREAVGVVGGIVHSAGNTVQGGIKGVTPENWDAGMALHTRAILGLVQEFREDLRQVPGAAIVALASINATLGAGATPIYCAAKGAVVSLVRSMADELSHENIRINSLSPGIIATPLMVKETAKMPAGMLERPIMLGRFGDPVEVGRAIRFLLSNEASYITATELMVDGGMVHSIRFS